MAVEVSAGLVTMRRSFVLHSNENRGSSLRPQAVLNTLGGGRGAWGVNEYSYQGGEKGAALD